MATQSVAAMVGMPAWWHLLPDSYFHMPFGDNNNVHLGATLNAPFGFSTKYDRNWTGRYHGIYSKLQAIDLGIAVSYDVNPYVSFGGAVFAERLNVNLSNAIDFGSILNARRVPSFSRVVPMVTHTSKVTIPAWASHWGVVQSR